MKRGLNGLSSSDDRALTKYLAQAAASGDLQDAALALSLPLVAQDRDGDVVGALLSIPPGTLAQTVQQAGYEHHVLLMMLKYSKIKALAVSEAARGRGLGKALLKRCVQMYWQLDYQLLFGQFETERALGPFYARQGFTVLQPGEALDVGFLLTGQSMWLRSEQGEQIFYRWARE